MLLRRGYTACVVIQINICLNSLDYLRASTCSKSTQTVMIQGIDEKQTAPIDP